MVKKLIVNFALCIGALAYEENIFNVQVLKANGLNISLYSSQKDNTSYGFVENNNGSRNFLGNVNKNEYSIDIYNKGSCLIKNIKNNDFSILCKDEETILKKDDFKAEIIQLSLKDKLQVSPDKVIEFDFVDDLLKIESKDRKLQRIVDDFNQNLDKKSLKDKIMQIHKKWKNDAEIFYENLSQSFIFYYDKKIISLGKNTYIYEGGAHGMNSMQRKTYDIDSMKLINLKNELKIENDQFVNMIKTKLLKEHEESDFFNIDEIKPSEKFEVRQNGLILIWEPYEIGPYSSGAIELFVSYEELKPYWRSKSKLAYLSL
ncbi:RsiV family protein [Campylobacter insulaenigrae]|uniref:RsiV family protein n=1 Tax=Campylobacter insulaenigrae TaxID=260714 RepID=UPI002153810F|nr:RsiV family protein [Campylobacter insulaenigrae]MCR6571910.1 RsiV family protein [Campylobacter insulaenigrae]MCR6574955.1 RsiV family protein [Campylobacter insulaenigrae]MCR6581258.1 RsiV family protein [Campylobacter insulaenigrae]